MSDRWVNARIEVVVPLDGITPDSPKEDKLGAATLAFDDLVDVLPDYWQEHVCSVKYEDMEAT